MVSKSGCDCRWGRNCRRRNQGRGQAVNLSIKKWGCKKRTISKLHKKRLCLYHHSQRTWTRGAKKDGDVHVSLRHTISYHSHKQAGSKALFGLVLWDSGKTLFFYFANLDWLIFQQSARPTNIKQVYSCVLSLFVERQAMNLDIKHRMNSILTCDYTCKYVYVHMSALNARAAWTISICFQRAGW